MKTVKAFLVLCLLVTAFLGRNAKSAPAAAPIRSSGDSGKIVFAGVRSSRQGIKPFPSPSGWQAAIRTMAGYFEGANPCAIWIVGQIRRPKTAFLSFPGDGKTYPHIQFNGVDSHEDYLNFFDKAGIKVFLQVEPAHADVVTLIDLVLSRYRNHPCVIGFGIDVEWYREADKPGFGIKVDDNAARIWETKVKSINPAYRLFLKHWNKRWMPKSYRGDIIFVDDSQIFKGLEAMVKEFTTDWAPAFYPNTVLFQIGYRSDKPWWRKLPSPPKTIGEAIQKKIDQDMGIIWVDFSLKDIMPPGDI